MALHRIPLALFAPAAHWLARLPAGPGRSALLPGTAGRLGWGSAIGGGAPLGLLAAEPDAVFCGGLRALQEAQRWLAPRADRPPLAALLIGSLGYGLGEELQQGRAPRAGAAEPTVWLAGYRAVCAVGRGRARVCGEDRAAVERLAAHLLAPAPLRAPLPPALPEPQPSTSDAEYLRQIERIQAYIRAGDAYQVNLSRRLAWRGVQRAAGPALFAALARSAPAPFAAFLELPGQLLLSNSPERFLRVAGSAIETQPIKGTRPRGADRARDRALARELERSAKDRAEHVMIVDLERNDLGRICRTGSVAVRELARRTALPTVHHLVSSVVGTLRDPLDWPQLLRATFPGGSITGAPKRRAMQIIAELEPVPRGPYTGAIGYFDASGGADLSIAIRTAVLREGELALHVGGGIVADSSPADELAETWHKARAFTALGKPPAHEC